MLVVPAPVGHGGETRIEGIVAKPLPDALDGHDNVDAFQLDRHRCSFAVYHSLFNRKFSHSLRRVNAQI